MPLCNAAPAPPALEGRPFHGAPARSSAGLVVSGKYGMAVRFFETHAGETSRLGYSSAHFAVVAYANLGRVGEVFKTIEDMREKARLWRWAGLPRRPARRKRGSRLRCTSQSLPGLCSPQGMRPNRATLTSAITALYKCSKQRRGLAAAHAAYRCAPLDTMPLRLCTRRLRHRRHRLSVLVAGCGLRSRLSRRVWTRGRRGRGC